MQPPFPIYLLRHGQTEWNAIRRVQGAVDSPLTARGVQQARAMGATLASRLDPTLDWDLVASPQGRAACTAGIIAGMTGMDLRFDHRLREISLGAWDGLMADDVRASNPELTARPGWNFFSPGGESYDAISARAADWLASVSGPTIAVCHGMLSRVVRALYCGQTDVDLIAGFAVSQNGFYLLAEGQITFIESIQNDTSVSDLPAASRPDRVQSR